MVKYILLLMTILSLTACAGTVQTNTARTLITIHDGAKVSAEAASAACDQGLIKPLPCHEMKIGYDAFREEWPKTADALTIYLQSPAETGQEQFASHYQMFMGLYNQLFAALLKNGVIKLTEGVK
jgi:hypothetical protein